MRCCADTCASARVWMRTSRAIRPRVMPRRYGWPIACAPIGRCVGPSCWPRVTLRRRCGCGSMAERTTTEAYLEKLREAGIGARAEARVPSAVVLDAPCDVQDLPGFAAGLVSVQDLGAQCVAFPLGLGRRSTGARCLCGARRKNRSHRGTGTALWPSWWRSTSTRSGSTRVRENLSAGNCVPNSSAATAAQPAPWWDGVPFDRILLDAPCSALGVIRRHPDIRLRKSPSDIDKLPALQGPLAALRLGTCWRAEAAWSMPPAP